MIHSDMVDRLKIRGFKTQGFAKALREMTEDPNIMPARIVPDAYRVDLSKVYCPTTVSNANPDPEPIRIPFGLRYLERLAGQR